MTPGIARAERVARAQGERPDVPADQVKGDAYHKGWKMAYRLRAENLKLKADGKKYIGAKKIEKLVKAECGDGPANGTIEKMVTDGKTSPAKQGRAVHMPPEVGNFLARVTILLRAHSIAVYADVIIENAKLLLSTHKASDRFALKINNEDGSVAEWDEDKLRRWYRDHFLTLPGIGTKAQRGLDAQRLKWCTADNFRQAYQNWEDVHVEAGIAYLNPKYNPEEPQSQRILFDPAELHRSASFDEVCLEGDTGQNRKNHSENTVTYSSDGQVDDGESISGRGSARATGIGCSYLDNEPGCCVVLLKGESADAALLDKAPTMMVAGKARKGHVIYTPGGGMNNDCIVDVMRKAITWRWEEGGDSPWEQKNTTKMRVITTDGVGIHVNPVFLQWALDNHIRIVLRCPYSSSKTQPEDVLSFWLLKNNRDTGFYKAKQQRLTQLFSSSGGRTVALSDTDILDCLGPAWTQTFTTEMNQKAYDNTGYRPNTRKPYWDLVEKETAAKRTVRQASKTKGTDLNYAAAVEGIGKLLGVGAEEEPEREKTSRLTAGDIALIPGGANGPKAMPFARLKTAVSEIKTITVADARKALADARAPTDGTGPHLKARLMLCAAFHHNLGILPYGWLDADGHAGLRTALAEAAAMFEANGYVNRLPEGEHRTNAQQVITYWLTRTAMSASDASEAAENATSTAVGQLKKMFSVPAPPIAAPTPAAGTSA